MRIWTACAPDPRKRSVYLDAEVLKEMHAEAKRQGRSLSQIVRYALRLAMPTIKRFPTVNEDAQVPQARAKGEDAC